jgi:hypothetical protein
MLASTASHPQRLYIYIYIDYVCICVCIAPDIWDVWDIWGSTHSVFISYWNQAAAGLDYNWARFDPLKEEEVSEALSY